MIYNLLELLLQCSARTIVAKKVIYSCMYMYNLKATYKCI